MMTSRNKSFYRHSGSTKKRQPHYKIIRKAAEEDPSRTAPSHPGAFQERLAFYLSEQEEQFASVLAGSGFSFDLVLGGERIGFRRKSDRYTDDTMENVETVFLAFPQNGDKKTGSAFGTRLSQDTAFLPKGTSTMPRPRSGLPDS